MDNRTDTKGLFARIIQEMYKRMTRGEKITGFEICEDFTDKVRDRGFYNAIQILRCFGLVENYSCYEKKEGVIGYYIRLSDIGKEIVDLSQTLPKRNLS